eukprot:1718935-Rhodomonas_salina.2
MIEHDQFSSRAARRRQLAAGLSSVCLLLCVLAQLLNNLPWRQKIPGRDGTARPTLLEISPSRRNRALPTVLLELHQLVSDVKPKSYDVGAGGKSRDSRGRVAVSSGLQSVGVTDEEIMRMADVLRKLHAKEATVDQAVAAAKKGLIDPLAIINTAQSAATSEVRKPQSSSHCLG